METINADEIDWDAMMRDFAPPEWDLMLSAAAKNELSRVRYFIEQCQVPPSHSNRMGQTALHVAALWGHTDIVRYLAATAGAHLNATNRLNGATPLHSALQSNKLTAEQQVAVVQILLQAGADPLVQDAAGKCAIAYVTKQHPLYQNASLIQQMTPPPVTKDTIRESLLRSVVATTPGCRVVVPKKNNTVA